MVDVAVTAQLQQWSFDKPTTVRPDRSDSTATSPDPDLYDGDTVRLDTAAVDHKPSLASSESIFQERYLSSEEDLSPMEPDTEEDNEEEFAAEIVTAKRMSIQVPMVKHGDMAVMVSIVSAGRPKIVNLPNISSPIPIREKTERSASLANLPPAVKAQFAPQPSRNSLAVPLSAPISGPKIPLYSPRRPSSSRPAFTPETSSLRISTSSSSIDDANKSTSSLSSISSSSKRPASAMTTPEVSQGSQRMPLPRAATMPFPPLTPQSPEAHSFLSSDPFGTDSTSAASPIIKSAPHRRLRSISQKLSLAKIAVNTANKKFSRGGTMPPTPASPFTPSTPQSAPAPASSFSPPRLRSRRNSKMVPRGADERAPVIEIPPMPSQNKKPIGKLVARGADERAPPLELPPFPEDDGADPVMTIKARRVRKRKSLMDLL